MIADAKDFITPHITDSHTLDYPCFHTGFVCEYELPRWDPIHIGRFALDISPSRHVVMLWNAVVIPNVGPHGNGYVPYLLTLFFFILFANLLGLIPYGATATKDIAIT